MTSRKANSKPNKHADAESRLSSADHDLISEIDTVLLSQQNEDYFPIVIEVPQQALTPEIKNLIQKHDVAVESDTTLRINTKAVSDRFIPELMAVCPNVKFNYSNFISHPGNLFVKNLSKAKLNYSRMFKFFQSKSLYNSLQELNIFNQHSDSDDDIFAILRFENYLDAEYLMSKPPNKNPFNSNSSSHLYLNKYISKKQRKLNEDVDEFNSYNSLIVENLAAFFPSNFKFTTQSLKPFFKKFEIFNGIKSIYFPLELTDNENSFRFLNFGFLNFEANDNINMNVLKCIYFLNNFTFDQFMEFTEEKFHSVTNDVGENTPLEERPRGIRISISQHKHNHHLYQFYPTFMNFDHGNLTVNYASLNFHSALINNYLKYVNYQETNVYVNNFSTIFKNNDQLWETFWSKFGQIKAAKIIKPQFYSKDNQSVGKIGFVFFRDFKMALKAIIMTNNKLINLNNSNFVIKTSFAIQKLNKDKKTSSASGPSPVHTTVSPSERYPKDAVEFYPNPPSFYPYFYDMTNSAAPDNANESDESHDDEPSYTYGPPSIAPVGMPMPMAYVPLQPQMFSSYPYYQYYNTYHQV